MQWTGLNELREKFLHFFEEKGHLRLPSFSLIPKDDKSLLLINSGMAPMKKYFTGEVTPPRKRVTTCQKCIRTPDIERVGKTARHGTYFEMLGNFSFGDYFKSEATAWAWEFCTQVMEMDVDRLYVTIYQDDDQAFDIWTKDVGVDPAHIVRLGKEDNFWEHGPGPCGPCSEIYYDRGEQYGCGSPTCGPGCDCDRFCEFWNLVFTQFDSDGKGTYTPLEHPNIDTGMGLERLACICQGVDNLFEVDTVRNIMGHLSKIAGVTYHEDPDKDVSLRVITDHIRSCTMMIGDGVMPSNEGRGYVLRRLLRRAARHGRLLGIQRPFLAELVNTVVAENPAYPELADKKGLIQKVVAVEEENFSRTIDQGLSLLEEMLSRLDAQQISRLSGEDAFRLNDTYGFPLDLTMDILAERGFTVDEEAFHRLMAQQKERARKARKSEDVDAWKGEDSLPADTPATVFVGYTQDECDAALLALLKDGAPAEYAGVSEKCILVLDQTPFYGESGGQVGDAGVITFGSSVFAVKDVTRTSGGVFLHHGVVTEGVIAPGKPAHCAIDADRRMRIRRNHTAAHLLQAALRQVLGTHVEQAGQLVSERSVRFDFTHFSAMTEEELKAVQQQINAWILQGIPVENPEMPIEEARKLGAMALFGEKYGDVVRVVNIPGASVEFCGGTHVDNTARLGLFRLISESSVAAGVRRIEAVTGTGVLEMLDRYQAITGAAAAAFKVGKPDEIAFRASQVLNELKEKDKEIASLRDQIARTRLEGLFADAEEVDGVRILCAYLRGTGGDALRAMCDRAKEYMPNVVAVLAGGDANKVTFCAACGAAAVQKGAHAGKLIKEVAAVAGGSGGGRPESAMAGAPDVTKVDEALNAVRELLQRQMS